jgi:hypothetical protein
MKQQQVVAILAGACLAGCGALTARAITAGQVDTFTDGTTAGWAGGDVVQVVTGGGPAGAGDNYLQFTSNGLGGSGSKLATNNSIQWNGNYAAAGVTSISIDMLNPNGSPSGGLAMRLLLFGPSGSRWSSTVADIVPADSQWHHENFSLLAQDLTEVLGSDTYEQLIAGVGMLQIRYDASTLPSPAGTTYAGSLGVDNITAVVTGPTSVAWLGGAGNWSDGTKWQGGIAPNSSSRIALIDNGNATASSVTLDANETVASVTLDAGDSLTIADGQTLTLAGAGSSAFNGSLSFNGSGKIDLGSNRLTISTDLATVRGFIQNSHIITTAAGGALGYVSQPSGQVEVGFTLLGDSDLDTHVNVADLANLAGNFGKTSGQFWINGDFDYNGNVNVADLADLAGNFGKTLGGGGGAGEFSAAATSVPEPSALAFLLLTPIVATRRRPGPRSRYLQ